jgi:hypothetical protein
MTLLGQLGHHRIARPAPAEHPIDLRVFFVQQIGALSVGVVLLVFGLLGATSGVPFLDTHGEHFLGMSSNGLLSALSLGVAALLVASALIGPRLASSVMLTLGVLFLLSGLGNMAVLHTKLNLLAFQMSNVAFSVVVGLLLLVLGAYGRISGNLPEDSPYAHPHPRLLEPPDQPTTPAEVAAEAAMRQAEIAVAEHRATDEQRRRVEAMAGLHSRDERRRAWMRLDG